jgi:hypothetical protein
LDYCILRNPIRRAEKFFECVAAFAKFGSDVHYRNRNLDLGSPPDVSAVRADITAVVRHWALTGIEVGSNEALEMES